jgi:hypothetical protein
MNVHHLKESRFSIVSVVVAVSMNELKTIFAKIVE